MRRVTLLLVILVMLVNMGMVGAQDDEMSISYGETVMGVIDNQSFEIEYTFTGSADDVVIIHMVGEGDDMDDPAIILLDPEFNVIASYDSRSRVTTAAELPVDGDYTIIATREDGRAGESVGSFSLTLLKPETLGTIPETGVLPYDDSIYYLVQTSEPFTVEMQTNNREYGLGLEIRIIDDGELDRVAWVNGDYTTALLSVNPAEFQTDIFFVTVTDGGRVIYLGGSDRTAEYSVRLAE